MNRQREKLKLPPPATARLVREPIRGAAHQPGGSKASPGAVLRQPPRGKPVDQLLSLAADVYLFHDPMQVGYADVEVDGHRETWALDREEFKHWLTERYYRATGTAPGNDALGKCTATLQARARFDGRQHAVALRVASRGDCVYIDLCDEQWHVVEVSAQGWRIMAKSPVRFRRENGMLPLPTPVAGGDIRQLNEFLNLERPRPGEPNQFVLVAAWLLAALWPTGPYPVLVLTGEQGTAKSTATRILRSLVDPNLMPLRSVAGSDRDLAVTAQNSWLVCFDNVSGIAPQMSDALCRLATGGGLATRKLFTNVSEVLMEAIRPQLHNGISGLSGRSDLLDRSIVISLQPIADEDRRTERELWTSFEAQRPGIFGALLSALSIGLRRLPSLCQGPRPRLADFADFATACEKAFATPGEFMRAFNEQRESMVADAIAQDGVADAIWRLVHEKKRPHFPGFEPLKINVTELLALLHSGLPRAEAGFAQVPPGWPKSGRGMSDHLKRAAPMLRRRGVSVTFEKDRDKRLIVCITRQSSTDQ